MAYIEKIHVSTGIYWVAIPEASLYLLCGCPADSVKHLMKRGLIVSGEKDGWSYETGPNAILLSDVLLQNGTFANMAEFPVLQMLYRQGTLIPNHPNNTGEKPLLIGAADQINAQMAYIHRGNYGLVSEEELRDTGLSSEEAHAMMRMKLSFAFGQIKHPRDLLDSRTIEDGCVEIKNDVFIERVSFNVFTIHYKGEAISVDLNLSLSDAYQAPYPLNDHLVNRDHFSIIHSGDGDGWDINRPTMSSVIFHQGKIYLVDAGPNVRMTLRALGIGINEVDGIFHTHAHDDHFAGLPAFMRSDRKIKYYAAPYVRSSVAKKLSALLSIDENRFEDFFIIEDLAVDRWTMIDGLEVRPLLSPHPVETAILQFRALGDDGYKTYGHYADIVSLDILQKMITDDPNKPGISQHFFDKVRADYLAPLDLKKIDIGGGMIHGQAHDFQNDPSQKIILSHTAHPLTPTQREIGSGAPFGTSDVLIPSYHDHTLHYAQAYLEQYLPEVPDHAIKALMNSEILTFNPETIMIKEGDHLNDLYLILTGSVESLNSTEELYGYLSAGSLVGEFNALNGSTATNTYRALTFTKTLKISIALYRQIIERYDLMADLITMMDRRIFLQKSRLFSNMLSYGIQNKIAAALYFIKVEPNENFQLPGDGNIGIIHDGKADLYCETLKVAHLQEGDVFGEDQLLKNSSLNFSLKVSKTCCIALLPTDLVHSIPVLQWKLIESAEHRRAIFAALKHF